MARSFSIGQLGRAAGLKPHTIRYYERRGLLPKALRNQAGYRRYSEKDLLRIRVVIAAKNLGFTLREIASMTAEDNGRPLAALAKPRLKSKRTEIQGRIRTLQSIQRNLQDALGACGRHCICAKVDEFRRRSM